MASQTLSPRASSSPRNGAEDGAAAGTDPDRGGAERRAEPAKPRQRLAVGARAQNRVGRSNGRSAAKANPQARRAPVRRPAPSGIQAVKGRVEAATQAVGGALSSAGATASGSVKQHPVPAALIGAGLAWLLLETRAARSAEARLLGQAKQVVGAVGRAVAPLGESAGESFEQARETAREVVSDSANAVGRAVGTAAQAVTGGAASLAEYARSSVVTAGTAIRGGAAAVGEAAKAGYGRSREAVADTWERHPLIVGASLLAAGVATGMFLPSVRGLGTSTGSGGAGEAAKAPKAAGSSIDEKGRATANSSRKLGSAQRGAKANPV